MPALRSPHTFAQHPAQGELLLRDEYILQLVFQFIADAQAVHCREEEVRTGLSCFLDPLKSLALSEQGW